MVGMSVEAASVCGLRWCWDVRAGLGVRLGWNKPSGLRVEAGEVSEGSVSEVGLARTVRPVRGPLVPGAPSPGPIPPRRRSAEWHPVGEHRQHREMPPASYHFTSRGIRDMRMELLSGCPAGRHSPTPTRSWLAGTYALGASLPPPY